MNFCTLLLTTIIIFAVTERSHRHTCTHRQRQRINFHRTKDERVIKIMNKQSGILKKPTLLECCTDWIKLILSGAHCVKHTKTHCEAEENTLQKKKQRRSTEREPRILTVLIGFCVQIKFYNRHKFYRTWTKFLLILIRFELAKKASVHKNSLKLVCARFANWDLC